MDRDVQVYGGTLLIVGVTYILSTYLNVAALNDLLVLTAVLGAIGLGGKIVKDRKLGEKLSQYSNSNSSGINYSFEQCVEIAKEWSKDHYSGRIKSKKGMSFDWTQASSDPVPVYNFASEEWIMVRYFYTQYGPKNKGTLIFVDATNGDFMTSKPVKWRDVKKEPFKELEMYNMTRRFFRSIPRKEGENQGSGPMIQGIPIQNMGGYSRADENGGSSG